MRLDKFLVEMNIGSRSQVKQYIKKGMVSVNGTNAASSDMKINEDTDTINITENNSAIPNTDTSYSINRQGV